MSYSDGRIKYIWNKDSIIINIPLPFGGRSSHDIKIPKSVKTPPLVMQSVGLNVPSKEFRIPPFTIPESYPLHVPLLGTLDISTNLYSNYFNWSAAYKLANTTKTIPSMKTNYHMTADSVFELLSFNVQGKSFIVIVILIFIIICILTIALVKLFLNVCILICSY